MLQKTSGKDFPYFFPLLYIFFNHNINRNQIIIIFCPQLTLKSGGNLAYFWEQN